MAGGWLRAGPAPFSPEYNIEKIILTYAYSCETASGVQARLHGPIELYAWYIATDCSLPSYGIQESSFQRYRSEVPLRSGSLSDKIYGTLAIALT